MYLKYLPNQGFAVEQIVTDADALTYLLHQGVRRSEGRRLLSALKTSAAATSRARVMAEFLEKHCAPSYGYIAFADFYARFQATLPERERADWSRTQVTRALPIQNRTVPHTGNKKIVPSLSWRT